MTDLIEASKPEILVSKTGPQWTRESTEKVARELRDLHEQASKTAVALKEKQGPLGRGIDTLINTVDQTFYPNSPKLGKPEQRLVTFGTFALSRSLEEQLKTIERLSQASTEGRRDDFNKEYRAITGKDWTGVNIQTPEQLASSQAMEKYKNNHYFFCDLATTYGAVYAGMFARGHASLYSKGFVLPFMAAVVAGALVKPAMTKLDGEHFYPVRDAVVGGIWGGLFPVYEWAGARTSEVLLHSKTVASFIGKGQPAVLETPGLFTSAIKTVETAKLRSGLISDAAFVVPGWIAYDSIGYPAQLVADRGAFKRELPTVGETGISHGRGIAMGIVAGPLIGVPLAQSTRYLLWPAIKGLREVSKL